MLSTQPRTEVTSPRDIIEQLSQSDCLLTAKDLAKLLSVSPKTLYSVSFRQSCVAALGSR